MSNIQSKMQGVCGLILALAMFFNKIPPSAKTSEVRLVNVRF
jgi:hypothetical protein